MEPDVLIGWEEPSQLRSDDTDDIAQHRDENQAPVESEGETGTTRRPHRESETIESVESNIGVLKADKKPLFGKRRCLLT